MSGINREMEKKKGGKKERKKRKRTEASSFKQLGVKHQLTSFKSWKVSLVVIPHNSNYDKNQTSYNLYSYTLFQPLSNISDKMPLHQYITRLKPQQCGLRTPPLIPTYNHCTMIFEYKELQKYISCIQISAQSQQGGQPTKMNAGKVT